MESSIAPRRPQNGEVYKFWDSVKHSFDHLQQEDYDNLRQIFDKNEYHTYFPKIFFYSGYDLGHPFTIFSYTFP